MDIHICLLKCPRILMKKFSSSYAYKKVVLIISCMLLPGELSKEINPIHYTLLRNILSSHTLHLTLLFT